MRNNYWFMVLISFMLITAGAIILHHFLICGRLYDAEDFLHHEVFFVLLIGITFGLGLAAYSTKRRKK